MKILAIFVILLTICSMSLSKKSMKSNTNKAKKSTSTNELTNKKASSQTNKSDPGAILPSVAVNNKYFIS